jgi:hypothetical protein
LGFYHRNCIKWKKQKEFLLMAQGKGMENASQHMNSMARQSKAKPKASRGKARQGKARQGKARQGKARQERHGMAGHKNTKLR